MKNMKFMKGRGLATKGTNGERVGHKRRKRHKGILTV